MIVGWLCDGELEYKLPHYVFVLVKEASDIDPQEMDREEEGQDHVQLKLVSVG